MFMGERRVSGYLPDRRENHQPHRPIYHDSDEQRGRSPSRDINDDPRHRSVGREHRYGPTLRNWTPRERSMSASRRAHAPRRPTCNAIEVPEQSVKAAVHPSQQIHAAASRPVTDVAAANTQSIPSSSTTPYDHDTNKGKAKATDPRVRSKDLSRTKLIWTPVVTSQSSKGLEARTPIQSRPLSIEDSTKAASRSSPLDVEMTDTLSLPTPGSNPSLGGQLVQGFIALGGQSFSYCHQALERDAFAATLKEKSEKRVAAEANSKPLPSYLNYLSLQEQEAGELLKRASNKATGLQAGLKVQAEVVVKQLVKHVEDLVQYKSSQSQSIHPDVMESVKADLQSCRSEIGTFQSRFDEHKAAAHIRVGSLANELKDLQVQTTRQTRLINEQEGASKTFQESVMAQVQAVENAATKAPGQAKAGSSQFSEHVQLRDNFEKLKTENAALRKELENLRTTTISRQEFDLFKQELSQSRSAKPTSPEVNPTVLDAYIARYNLEMQSLRKDHASTKDLLSIMSMQSKDLKDQHERLTPLVYETSGTVKSYDTRIDNIVKQLGLLEDKINGPQSSVAQSPAYPSPPTPIHSHIPAKLESDFQDFVTSTNGRILRISNDIMANFNAIKALNMRYNNLTTEQLAQKIAGIVLPMLPSIQTEQGQLKLALNSIKQAIEQQGVSLEKTAGRLAAIEDEHKSVHGKLVQFRDDHVRELTVLEEQIKQSLLQSYQAQERVITTMKADQIDIATRTGMLEKSLESQPQGQDSLALQIDEAVNDRVHEVEQRLGMHVERLDACEATSKRFDIFLKETTKTLETTMEQVQKSKHDCVVHSEEVARERTHLYQRLDNADNRIQELSCQGSSYTDALHKTTDRLKNTEEIIKSLENTTKSHSESIEALDLDMLKHFQPPKTHPQPLPPSHTPSNTSTTSKTSNPSLPLQATASASSSSSTVKALQWTPQFILPKSAGTLSSPDAKGNPPVTRPVSRGGTKRRTDSPARDPRGNKRPKAAIASMNSSKFVDLTTDDEEDPASPAAATPAMLTGH